MFDIGWSELVVIGVVALIAIGPKELPGVLRGVGHWIGKMRRMASDFQDQFKEAMREAEVADLKKQFDDASNAASSMTSGFGNPLDSARQEMEKTFSSDALTPSSTSSENTIASAAAQAPDIVDAFPAAEAQPSAIAGATPAEIKPDTIKTDEIKPDETKPDDMKSGEIKRSGAA